MREPIKQLVLVGTPLHLISAICYLRGLSHETTTDLIIIDDFSRAKEYSNTVRSLGIFREVELVFPRGTRGGSKLKETLVSQLFGKPKTDEWLVSVCGDIANNKYDRFICASMMPIVHDAVGALANCEFDTVLIDDGTGSHTGAIYKGVSCFDQILSFLALKADKQALYKALAKLIINVLTLNRLKMHITEINLFSPGRSERDVYKKTIQVNSLLINSKAKQDISRVFLDDDCTLYDKTPFIYLAMSSDVDDAMSQAEARFIQDIVRLNLKVLVRPHPRGMNPAIVTSGCLIDKSGVSWEALLAGGYVSEETVLIGFASSAQVMPNYLFGLEPRVILLHHLIEENNDFTVSSEVTTKDLLKRYQHKERVCAPKTLAEFESMVAKLDFAYN